MASRKKLKRNIKHIINAVADSCIVGNATSEGDEKSAYQQLFIETLHIHQDIVARISHTEPGNVKGFYSKLHSDFNQGIAGICSELDNLLKKQ